MSIDLARPAIAVLVVFARVAPYLMTLPLLGEDMVPGRLRLLAAMGLAVALTPLLAPPLAMVPSAPLPLALLILPELVKGVALGLLTRIMWLAIGMGFAIASVQVGLSSALIPDPAQGQTPAVSQLAALAATIAAFGLGLHHLWIAALVKSYAAFPPGIVPLSGALLPLAVAATGRALAIALGMAAPLIAFGLIFNLALGLTARLAPQIQVFFMAQPLMILIGMGVLAAGCGAMIGFALDAQRDWLRLLWG